MIPLKSLRTLLDRDSGNSRGNLTPELVKFYDGDLPISEPSDNSPSIGTNFAAGIDGLVTYNLPGQSGGGDITRNSKEDTTLMALLRASYGNMGEGANAIRLNPGHVWTPSGIAPEHAVIFRAQEQFSGGVPRKYRVIFFAGIDGIRSLKKGYTAVPRALLDEDSEAWVFTNEEGKKVVLSDYPMLEGRVISFGDEDYVDPKIALRYMRQEMGIKYLLIEGGPRFAGSVVKEYLHDDVFLTIANTIMGNDYGSGRLSFIMGVLFTPENAPTYDLVSVKLDGEEGNFMFLHWRRHLAKK